MSESTAQERDRQASVDAVREERRRVAKAAIDALAALVGVDSPTGSVERPSETEPRVPRHGFWRGVSAPAPPGTAIGYLFEIGRILGGNAAPRPDPQPGAPDNEMISGARVVERAREVTRMVAEGTRLEERRVASDRYSTLHTIMGGDEALEAAGLDETAVREMTVSAWMAALTSALIARDARKFEQGQQAAREGS